MSNEAILMSNEEILMSTHNICFYGELEKSCNYHHIPSLSGLLLIWSTVKHLHSHSVRSEICLFV